MYGYRTKRSRKVYKSGRRRKTAVAKGRRAIRRRSYRKVGVQRPKWLAPIRSAGRMRFIYQDTGFTASLSSLNSWTALHVFTGNSPFDPDNTGVGVQPYGWDENVNSTMFTTTNCVASSIKVYFDHTGDEIHRLHCIVFPWEVGNPAITDLSDLRMVPRHKETVYDPENETTRGARISNYCSTRRFFSERSSLNDNFVGTYTGGPSLQWMWIVVFSAPELTGVNTSTIRFDVKIKYYTKLNRTYSLPNES